MIKKYQILLALLILPFISIMAQQPFDEYGYKVKVATLSKGKYQEFFDQDTLVVVGSVVLNTNTGKIVYFVMYDTVYSEATLEPELISRWLSPDPLSDEFSNESPYNFVHNNPIKFVDPDGKAALDFTLLNAKDGAGGKGHMAAVVQDGSGKYYYATMGAAENASVSKMASGGVNGGMNVVELTGAKSMKDAIAMAKTDTNNSPYTDQVTFTTTSEQDQQIFESITGKAEKVNSGEDKYNVVSNNCTDAVERPIESATGVGLPDNVVPNTNFQNVKENKEVIQANLNLQSGNYTVKPLTSGLDGYQPKQVVTKKD